MKQWSIENQKKRRLEVQTLHREHCYHLYGDDGQFALERNVDWRGYLWNSMSFLNGEKKHIVKANAMLKYLTDKGGSDFWSSAVTMILARFSDKLDPEVKKALENRLVDYVKMCSNSSYNGYNDNFPSMAALTTIIGAQLLGMTDYIEKGIKILDGLKLMLKRRGFISEYTSPTYSALTVTCLAEIVNLVDDPKIEQTALKAEQRVWTELASHFHRETSFLAGPHGRAYMVDMCGHLHNFHILFYQVLGKNLFVNPTNAMFPYQDKQVLHHGVPEFMQSHVGWLTTPDFHIPDYAADLALNKEYPYNVKGTSEFGAFPRNWCGKGRHEKAPVQEFQAGHTLLNTYMTEDYALGTATRPFLDSTTNTAFHLTYRRGQDKKIQNVATAFSRFIMNERKPEPNQHFSTDGRALIVSKDSSALVTYHGKPPWGAKPPFETNKFNSLKLSILIPCFYKKPSEIWLGNNQCDVWQGDCEDSTSIFIKDGPVYMAIHPLIYTDYGRKKAVKIEEYNDYGLISLYNYEGEKREFSDYELFSCMNGFVFEVAQEKDFSNFEGFRKFHSDFTVSDQFKENTAMREVIYERDDLKLSLMISPVSAGIKYMAVNDQLLEEPKFEADGFDNEQLPWLS